MAVANEEFALKLEKRMPPADHALIEAAAQTPGGWVYDIDWPYGPSEHVPPEAIRGSWEVDANGKMTGQFAVNDRYRPIVFTLRTLKPYMHAAAKANPDQWIVEIDESAEHLFPAIPPSGQRGWWYVDKHGTITRKFRANSEFAGIP